ncbi:hypothetical protein NL676_012382 [Syzygium grande]|nr:hypothetical protein NL676_012382 [Syzygium grande]
MDVEPADWNFDEELIESDKELELMEQDLELEEMDSREEPREAESKIDSMDSRGRARPPRTAAAVLNKLALVDDSSVERSSEVAEQQQLTTEATNVEDGSNFEDVGGTAATRMLAWTAGRKELLQRLRGKSTSDPQRKFSLVS